MSKAIIQYLKDSLKEVIPDSEKTVYRLEESGPTEIEIWKTEVTTDEQFIAFKNKGIDADDDGFTLILHYQEP